MISAIMINWACAYAARSTESTRETSSVDINFAEKCEKYEKCAKKTKMRRPDYIEFAAQKKKDAHLKHSTH